MIERASPIARLWRKTVTQGGCIVWTGAVAGFGYPKLGIVENGRKRFVNGHRWLYEQCFGAVAVGKVVRHSCDTPGCLALQHLEVGTQRQNLAESKERGRSSLGMRHGMARVSDEDVRAIRRAHVAGELQRAIARRFGLSQTQVSRIVTGRRWRSIPMIPAWIVSVLDRELPDLTGAERDRIAEALYESAFASLKQPIIDAIAIGAKTVLESRCVRDGKGDVAGEIARNSAQNVLNAMAEA